MKVRAMKEKREVPTCCVVDQFCTSPANLVTPVPARGVCYSCGEPVCAMCSSKRQYLDRGLRRVCNRCQVERLDNGSEEVVLRRLHRLAGVPYVKRPV